MPQPRHRKVKDTLDLETMTVTCSICGPNTPVFLQQILSNGNPFYQCDNVRKRNSKIAVARRRTDPELAKKHREANIQYNRTKVKGKHGLTPVEAEKLVAKIGECELCGDDVMLRIDHDHTTNLIRGVLCNNHNVGLGMFNDDPAMLEKAIRYLRYPPAQYRPHNYHVQEM